MKIIRLMMVMLILAVACVVSAASLPMAVENDFKPLKAVVIGQEGEGWLIDVGREQGVHEGDLFSAVDHGKPVVHPQTGEVLGSMQRATGLLQVIWVQPRFSQVRKISGVGALALGAEVRRFDGLTAIFIDETETGEQLYMTLRDTLGQLRWLGYRKAAGTYAAPVDAAQLSFYHNSEGLKVFGLDRQPLRLYPAAGYPGEVQPPSVAAAAAAATPAVVPPFVPAPAAASATADYKDLGQLPVLAHMAAFVRQENRLLLAVSDGNGWQVLDIGTGAKVVAQSPKIVMGRIIGLQWWQPEAKGKLYLAVTMQTDENAPGNINRSKRIESTLYRFAGDQPQIVHSVVANMVGSFDLDGDGRHETLLGQDLDRDITFGSRIRQYRPSGDDVVSSKADIPLPLGFPVIGGLLCRLGGTEGLSSVWVKNRSLYVARKGKSPSDVSGDMGGSLVSFSYDINSDAVNRLFRTASLEVAPICADLNGDGQSRIISTGSNVSLLSQFGVMPDIKKSWLVAVSYNGSKFRHQKIGPEIDDAAISGLTWDQNRLLLVVTYQDKESGSHLMMLENPKMTGGK
jgi:hypothetical protein